MNSKDIDIEIVALFNTIKGLVSSFGTDAYINLLEYGEDKRSIKELYLRHCRILSKFGLIEFYSDKGDKLEITPSVDMFLLYVKYYDEMNEIFDQLTPNEDQMSKTRKLFFKMFGAKESHCSSCCTEDLDD